MTTETSNARGELRMADIREDAREPLQLLREKLVRDEDGWAALCQLMPMLAAAPPPAAARGDVRGLGQPVLAGALFDFLGFLTTLDNPVRLGATCEATVAVELLSAWAAKRSLSLDEAAVKGWREALAAEGVQAGEVEQQPEARGVVGELVQMGDDEDGQPRLVINTTREAIKASNLVPFSQVEVRNG